MDKKGLFDIISVMKVINKYSINSYLLDMYNRDVIRYNDDNITINPNAKYKYIDRKIISSLFENETISIKKLNEKKNGIDLKSFINKVNDTKYNKLIYYLEYLALLYQHHL